MSKRLDLRELYDTHQGKLSDKWSSYLDAYGAVLEPYRDQPVRLLEIGIQNGGSLEIWAQYFPQVRKLVGCDIDPKCAELCYDDSRIQIVIGDASTPDVQARVLGHSPVFDIIIDDGSHTSSDIIKSFARYFAHLQDGGVYIAEDLHCSYWQGWGGGLFAPQSSISFFKLLADVINHEHWGIIKQRVELFKDFEPLQCMPLMEDLLAHVHSVEFANSLCIIRKRAPRDNQLGERLRVGLAEQITVGLRDNIVVTPDESSNSWALRSLADQNAIDRDRIAAERYSVIAERDRITAERDGVIAERDRIAAERDGVIAERDRIAAERDGIIAERDRILGSRSWRITRPLRWHGAKARLVKRLLAIMSRMDYRLLSYRLFYFISFIATVFWKELIRRFSHETPLVLNEILMPDGIKKTVAVIYIARGHTREEKDSIDVFIASYKRHHSGREHKLYVIFKGFENNRLLTAAKQKFDMPHESFEFEDAGFDIGAYVKAARLIEEQIVIFLNTHSKIRADDWVEKLVRPLQMNSIGLVGCTASYESLIRLSPEWFPMPPNPHVRSNAFAMDRKLFVDLTSKNDAIQTKMDAWKFESGKNSLTLRVKALNKDAVIVNVGGKIHVQARWMESGVFRHLLRSDELISDNQHRLFEEEPMMGKAKSSFFAWGIDRKFFFGPGK